MAHESPGQIFWRDFSVSFALFVTLRDRWPRRLVDLKDGAALPEDQPRCFEACSRHRIRDPAFGPGVRRLRTPNRLCFSFINISPRAMQSPYDLQTVQIIFDTLFGGENRPESGAEKRVIGE
jgi:hypothetical protein